MKCKILLTIDNVSFYTTASAIKNGVGQSESINDAARAVYKELMGYRKGESNILRKSIGCGGTGYFGHNAQINLV
jgi:hypothetical protein